MYRNIKKYKSRVQIYKYILLYNIHTSIIHKKIFYTYKISIKSKRKKIALDVDATLSEASGEHGRINKN